MYFTPRLYYSGGYMVICGIILRPVLTSSSKFQACVGVCEERLSHGDEKLEVYMGLPQETIV